MTRRRQSALTAQPASAGWWLRVLGVLLFVFQVHYVRFHLLTETHLDVHVAVAESSVHTDGDHHHDSDQHKPHTDLEHLVQMVVKHQASLLSLDFLPAETSLIFTRPNFLVVCTLYESGKAPGESPPDPLQPRAPPLA